VTYRPLSFLLSARQSLELDSQDPRWTYSTPHSYQRDLDKQWLMRLLRKEVALSDTSLFLSAKALDVETAMISSVVTLNSGALSLFKMVSKEMRDSPSIEEMKKIEAMAYAECAYETAKALVEEIAHHNGIKAIDEIIEAL
jgi:hypothetical protein